VHLAEPAHDRPDELAGALAVLVELLGQCKRATQVPGHERVGEVVCTGRRVRGGQPLDICGRDVDGRVQGDRDLLELPR
jgi:hypothetical protein